MTMDYLRSLIQSKDLVALHEFLQHHVSISGRDLGNINDNDPFSVVTAVILAHWSDEETLGVLRQLVALGADCSPPVDDIHRTPLHAAAARGLVETCTFLLSRGADPLARSAAVFPAYVVAVAHPSCLQLLMDNGLKHRLSATVSRTSVIQLALLLACGEGCFASVKLLLDQYGAKAGLAPGSALCNADMGTLLPLQVVVAAKSQEDGYRICKELLHHKADPGDNGSSQQFPMVDAIDSGAIGVLRAMLEFGVSITMGDDASVSALTRAASRDFPDIVKLLLDHGADVNGGSLRAFGSPMHQAVTSGPKCVDVLLKAGADLNVRSPTGLSCLHVVVEVNDNELLAKLLEAGADVNCKDEEGRAPLDYAARRMFYCCAVTLLDYGADPLQCNRFASDSFDIVKWLSAPEKEAFGDTLTGADSRMADCYTAFSDAFSKGVLWPTWTKQTHRMFPRNVKQAIFATLCCWKLRKDSVFAMLPRDVLPMVLTFVATRSKQNTWKFPKREDWAYSPEFLNAIVRCNTDHLLSKRVLEDLEKCVCTNHGPDYEPQPFYSCEDCNMCPRGQANLGFCGSCMVKCHAGHRVFLSTVQPSFCDCYGSARCKITDRLAVLADPEIHTMINNEEAEEGFLVCIETFPHVYEGQNMLQATPGELVRVRREDVQNGIGNCDIRGIKGSFPLNSQYVRWIQEFVAMGEDHEGTRENELSYKKGDFVLVLGPVEGKDAENKDDPWLGLLCSPEGAREGWFEGYRCDWVTQFHPGVFALKKEAALNFIELQKLRVPDENTDFEKGVTCGERAAELWEEIAKLKLPRPCFSTVGTLFMTARDLGVLYATLDEFQKAFDWNVKALTAILEMQPARPAVDIVNVLVNVIECGARASVPEKTLDVFYQDMCARMPEDNNAVPFMRLISLIAKSFSCGRIAEASGACEEFFEMARTLELPRNHPIWRDASYWLTMVGMTMADAPDAKESLAAKHALNVRFFGRMAPSNASFFDALSVSIAATLANSGGDSPAARERWAKRVVAAFSTLKLCIYQSRNLPSLTWRGMQERVQTLFANGVAYMILKKVDGPEPAAISVMAAELLALYPHNYKDTSAMIAWRPKTERSQFLLITCALRDKVQLIATRDLLSSKSETAGEPEMIEMPLADLNLPEDCLSFVLVAEVTTESEPMFVGTMHCPRALMSMYKPSAAMVEQVRQEFARVIEAEKKKLDLRAPPQKVASKPVLRGRPAATSGSSASSASGATWKTGAAVAVATVAAVAAVWYFWKRTDD